MKYDIETAYMCAEASAFVYLDWDECEQKLKKYMGTAAKPKHFEVNDAQAYAFKVDKETAVIAFRGTESINDALADLNSFHSDSDLGGDVHSGFKGEIDKIWPDVLKWVRSRYINKETTKIIVTGHSLGAAMATICTARLHDEGYDVTLYNFGSPRVGDKEWGKNLEGVDIYRFVNTSDIVTTVPPFGFYSHVGQLKYLSCTGNIHDNISFFQKIKDKMKGHFRAWKKGQFFSAVYDHFMAKYLEKINKNR